MFCKQELLFLNMLLIFLIRIKQGVKILFNPILSYFFARSYFVLFFGKCPILSYFFPLILVFHSLFITITSHENIPSKAFSLASLGIKILFAHIILESVFLTLFTA